MPRRDAPSRITDLEEAQTAHDRYIDSAQEPGLDEQDRVDRRSVGQLI